MVLLALFASESVRACATIWTDAFALVLARLRADSFPAVFSDISLRALAGTVHALPRVQASLLARTRATATTGTPLSELAGDALAQVGAPADSKAAREPAHRDDAERVSGMLRPARAAGPSTATPVRSRLDIGLGQEAWGVVSNAWLFLAWNLGLRRRRCPLLLCIWRVLSPVSQQLRIRILGRGGGSRSPDEFRVGLGEFRGVLVRAWGGELVWGCSWAWLPVPRRDVSLAGQVLGVQLGCSRNGMSRSSEFSGISWREELGSSSWLLLGLVRPHKSVSGWVGRTGENAALGVEELRGAWGKLLGIGDSGSKFWGAWA